MALEDNTPDQAPQQPNYFPPPPPSPLQQISQGFKVASAETPGVNYTGGRMDAQPRDIMTDQPATPPPPQPPRVNQNFVPNATREPSEWKDPHHPAEQAKIDPNILYSSKMPSPDEAVGVLKGSGTQLANWGSPQVAGLGRMMANLLGYPLDFYSHGAFGRMYDSATAKRVALHREEMNIARDRAVDIAHDIYMASRAHTDRYDEIFEEYKAHALTEDQAKKRIMNMALSEPGGADHWLIEATKNGGIGGALSLIKSREAKARDTYSAAVALDMSPGRSGSGKTAKEESDFDKSIVAGAPGGPRPIPAPGQSQADADAAAAAEGKFDDPMTKDVNEQIKRDRGVGDDGLEMGRQLYETGKVNGMSATQLQKAAPDNYTRLEGVAADLNKRMNAAAADQPNDTPDTKLARMQHIDPTVAGKVKGLGEYQSDPKSPTNSPWKGLTQRVFKDYDEGRYAAVQKYFNPDSQNARLILRANALPETALTLIEATKPFALDETVAMKFIDEGGSIYVTGAPEYSTLTQAIQSYLNETVAVQTATGTLRSSIIDAMRQHFKAHMSVSQILGAMKVDLRNAGTVIDGMDQRWHETSGRNTHVPGYEPEKSALLHSILTDLNPNTGVVADDNAVPQRLRAASRPQPKASELPSWMTPKQSAKPMTREERQKWQNWLDTHPRSTPGWDKVNESLGINR